MASLPLGTKIVVVSPPTPVARTWRERLFTRPWRPFQKTRPEEHPMWDLMKNQDKVLCHGDTMYVTSEMFQRMNHHEAFKGYPT